MAGRDTNFRVFHQKRLTHSSCVVERAWYSDRTDIGGQSLIRGHIFKHVDIQEFAETQQYSTIHRIVLGLSKLDLNSQLEDSTSTIDTPDLLGKTPLWWASTRGDEEAVRILLAYGASLEIKSRQTPGVLHMARTPAIVDLLIDYGAQINCRDEVGRTPLHSCAYRGDPRGSSVALLESLLEHGADVDAQTRAGHTALHYTAMYGSVSHMPPLLTRGASLEARKLDGHTPLMDAVRCAQPSAIDFLLQNGADYTITSKQCKTILHVCASNGDIATMGVLTFARLQDVDIDAKDSYGLTARGCLQERTDLSEDLELAFEELLKSIRQQRTEAVDDADGSAPHSPEVISTCGEEEPYKFKRPGA
jgi:ankyrin repeat protein